MYVCVQKRINLAELVNENIDNVSTLCTDSSMCSAGIRLLYFPVLVCLFVHLHFSLCMYGTCVDVMMRCVAMLKTKS